jgi:uncharacterized protein YcaQ
MSAPVKLSKQDVAKALVHYQFRPAADQWEVYQRLQSIQFDPISPVGCNHDLVLNARLPDYKIGDWEKLAYQERRVYDGWDKQASLVPLDGWPLRRYIHSLHRRNYDKKIFEDHKHAVDAILKEITERGPMMPRDFDFQERRAEWKSHWYSPNVTKQTLRALWHSGLVMTVGRKNGQHLYDLTERAVPPHLYHQPLLNKQESLRQLGIERHKAVGIIRPSASAEMWSYQVMFYDRKEMLADLVERGEIVPVEVDGVKANATPEFLTYLDKPALSPRCIFVAPLDQFMWDRKMIAHLFGFDYVWEIYVPEAKRKWGYYVLPILFGNSLVARVEFYCRQGLLEMRCWHWQTDGSSAEFLVELERSLRDFMSYCSASRIEVAEGIDSRIRDLVKAI